MYYGVVTVLSRRVNFCGFNKSLVINYKLINYNLIINLFVWVLEYVKINSGFSCAVRMIEISNDLTKYVVE